VPLWWRWERSWYGYRCDSLVCSITDKNIGTFIIPYTQYVDMAEHYCPEYSCVVQELPCPHCGADDHEEVDL